MRKEKKSYELEKGYQIAFSPKGEEWEIYEQVVYFPLKGEIVQGSLFEWGELNKKEVKDGKTGI